MIIKDLLAWAKKELKEKNVGEPESSAELLLRDVLNYDRSKLFANLEQEISSKDERKYKRHISRRGEYEPVWQIIGKVEFWGRKFLVNKDVLLPRPETEFLIELALKEIKEKKFTRVLDVGTGSGAMIVTLAKEIPAGEFFASDISKKALRVAKKNSKNLNARVKFKHGSLFEPWQKEVFDLVVANLPYIPEEDMDSLSLDIHHYEPRLALTGGKGGLVLYEKFLQELPRHLSDEGLVLCEIGINQGGDFCKLVKRYLPEKNCKIFKDFADIDRIALIK